MRAWLDHRNMSARTASRLSGVTTAMICYVIAGQRDITIAKLDRVCSKALKCSLAEFFGPLPKERAA